jgi:predicted Zn-dependent peptidase
VVGWPSDVENITRAEALAYFDLNYAPNNLTACLVGDFDPEHAKALAQRYFGRLKRNSQPPEPMRTTEVEPQAEKRMIAYADTNPQAVARYHTVADGHRDEAALTVLGALLSGRTGRLYKSLVLDQKIATDAGAGQNGLKYEGYFSLSATARPGTPPEKVEQALYGELEKLQKTKVEDRELQKVKNRFAADEFRRLQSNFPLMLQLLLADNNRGWQTFFADPKQLAAVTADDVQRVATQYFKPERRAVILYYTKKAEAGAAPTDDDPLLQGLSDQEKAQVQRMKGMLSQMKPDQLQQMLMKLEEGAAAAPPEKARLLNVLKALVQQRLKGE